VAALRARGSDPVCIAYGAEAPRVVDGIEWTPGPAQPALLLDTYTMPERHALAVFHDEGEPPPGIRLAIAIEPVPGVETLAGLRHAPLRAPFWGLPERRVRPAVERILVTTGGGALQAAGVATAAALRDAYPGATVALVRGPYATFEPPPGVELVDAPPSLLPELLAADVVVTAAGQSALEAAATGAATVAIPLAPNQWPNARALQDAGAAVVVPPDDVVAAVGALDRHALAAAGQRAVDGYGALRIAWRLASL
jgi:hypothetical protein